MMYHRLGWMAAGLICAAVAGAPASVRAQEPPAPAPLPAPLPAGGHGHDHASWWPTVIGAVAGAYLWPMAFPAVTEVALVGSAGPVESAIGTVATLPAAAAESVGVEVPAVGAMDTLTSWRLSNWYSPAIGALHGAYLGHLFGR